MILALWFFLFSQQTGRGLPLEDMGRIREHIYREPELGNREYKTQSFLLKELVAAGFNRIQTVAKTGLRVVHDTGKPGPVIAFRAELDALPQGDDRKPNAAKGMHACGHDLHTAALFGCAIAIKNDPNLSGVFVFLFQPASEGMPEGESGGVSQLLTDGALTNPEPDVIIGFHVMDHLKKGAIGYREGSFLARSDRFSVSLSGMQAPLTKPWEGNNPIPAVAQIVSAVPSLVHQGLPIGAAIHVRFDEIVSNSPRYRHAKTARLRGTILSFDPEIGDLVPQMMDQAIAGIAQAHGVSYVFENETIFPVLVNHPDWTNKIVRELRSRGKTIEEVPQMLFDQDFAYYGQQVPAVYFLLGTGGDPDDPGLHDKAFKPSAEVLRQGAELFYTIAKALCGER